MKSLRTKITMLTVCAIVASMSIATLLGAVAIRTIGSSNSDEMLLLLCEAGEKNLDSYFESMAQSVEMVSAYAEADLEELELSRLDEHLERVKEIFEKMTYKTHGVLTYYYRIDPAVSESAQGFWYVNLDGEGFREHEVTDITGYDRRIRRRWSGSRSPGRPEGWSGSLPTSRTTWTCASFPTTSPSTGGIALSA